jgi:hypothetical protein
MMLALKAEGALASTMRVLTPALTQALRLTADRNGDLPVEFRVPAGRVTVLISSTASVKPVFRLGAQSRAVPTCASIPLAPTAETGGTITTVDCKFSELANYSALAAPAQSFALTVPARGRVSIDLDSAAFPPVLSVTNTSGDVLGLAFASSPTKVNLTNPQADPGEIRILASTASQALGAFKVTTTFTPASAPVASSVGEEAVSWRRAHEESPRGSKFIQPRPDSPGAALFR